MNLPEISVESWPALNLPKADILASLQFLAFKTKKPVTFRWYTEDEGYSDQAVSVRVFVKDGLAAIHSLEHVVINGQTHPLSSEQRGMASALVQDGWKKISDADGQFIGAVDHNRIIFPIEITASDNEAARAILAYVIETAIPLLDFDVDDMLREKEAEFAQHFTSAFHASVQSRLELRKEELR